MVGGSLRAIPFDKGAAERLNTALCWPKEVYRKRTCFRVFFSGHQCTRSVAALPSIHRTHRRVFREYSPYRHHSPDLIGGSCAAGMGTILQERVPLPPQCLEGLSIRGREWKKRASWINSRPSGARYGRWTRGRLSSPASSSRSRRWIVFLMLWRDSRVEMSRVSLSWRKPPCFCRDRGFFFSDCGEMWVGVFNILYFSYWLYSLSKQ